MVESIELSKGQKYAILTSLRVFECLCSKDMYCTNMALGVAISFIVQLIITYLLYRFELPSKFVKAFVGIYFALYSIVSIIRLVSLEGILPIGASATVGVIVLIGVCWYCSNMNTKSLLRSALVVGFIVIMGLLVILYGLFPSMKISNLTTTSNNESVLHYALSDLLHSVDLVLLVAFPTKDLPVKYLSFKLLSLEILTLVGMGVLSGISVVSNYPFIELATYSQPFGVQRSDAIYTSIATLMCVLNVSLAIALSKRQLIINS